VAANALTAAEAKSHSGENTCEEGSSSSLAENPYWVFISFLYAWIAADIAGRFSRVVSEYKPSKPKGWSTRVRSHLTLAGFVVGTSWLAWTQAFEKHHVRVPKEVVSPEALLMIVDFMILILYFTFVSVVGDERESGDNPTPPHPPWKHSSYWILLILVAYAVWDFFTYWLIPKWANCPQKDSFLAHSWSSIFCAILASLALAWIRRIRIERVFWTSVGDVSLIFLIIFYRALKQLSHLYPVPSLGEQIKRLVMGNSVSIVAWITLLLFVCMGSLAGRYGHRMSPHP